MRDGTLWIIAMQQFNNTNIFKTFLKFHHHALHLSLCQKFLVPFRKIIHESFQNKNTTLINSFSLIDENKFDGGADRLLERTLSTTNRHVTFLPRYPRDSDLYPSASRHEFVSSEAITSAGSAINRGCRRIAAPLSNAIDKKFHGRRPKRAKVDSPRTDIRWRFMFAVPCPVIYLPRGAASQKFSASGTNKNSPSRPWLLLRSIHLRPPPLPPFCEIELERFSQGRTSLWLPYRVEEQFVGISVGLIGYILGSRASRPIFHRPELTNLRGKHCCYQWIVADEAIEFFNRITRECLLLGNDS